MAHAVESETKFKIMMLGDAGVGKTSIARRFVDDKFLSNYIHTIGIDFLEKTITFKGRKLKLQIWDTAGQERFRTLIRPYYRGAAGIVLAYDVTDPRTFQDIKEWVNCIAENSQACQITQKVLLANKVDLPKETHLISSEMGMRLADKLDMPFMEVSAKTGFGICEAFQLLANSIIQAQRNTPSNMKDDETVRLEAIPVVSKRERKCCQGGPGGDSGFN